METKGRIMGNISRAIIANFVVFVSGILTTVVVPRILNVENYSYWQLYMFYGTYLIYLELGWLEGIYLREGGKAYNNINFSMYKSQMYALVIYGIACVGILGVGVKYLGVEVQKQYIIKFVCIYFVLVLVKTFFSFLFQATGEIQKYARLNIIERVVFICILLAILIIKNQSYIMVIAADIISRIISLGIAIYYGKEIIHAKRSRYKDVVTEIGENIRIGSKLMFATVAGLLTIGIIRLGIEQCWDIETFGKVSFTISISNLIIIFIGAISTVLFPILSNIQDHKKLKKLYLNMRIPLGVLAFGLLSMYLPLSMIINVWLPAYKESIRYMALIFPICFYESKMSILIITFLKSLRKEKNILYINLITLLISLIVSLATIYGLRNLELAVASILIVSMFKSILGELVLSKILHMPIIRLITEEMILTVLFIYANWFMGGINGFIVYIIGFGVYSTMKIRKIRDSIIWLKK